MSGWLPLQHRSIGLGAFFPVSYSKHKDFFPFSSLKNNIIHNLSSRNLFVQHSRNNNLENSFRTPERIENFSRFFFSPSVSPFLLSRARCTFAGRREFFFFSSNAFIFTPSTSIHRTAAPPSNWSEINETNNPNWKLQKTKAMSQKRPKLSSHRQQETARVRSEENESMKSRPWDDKLRHMHQSWTRCLRIVFFFSPSGWKKGCAAFAYRNLFPTRTKNPAKNFALTNESTERMRKSWQFLRWPPADAGTTNERSKINWMLSLCISFWILV